MDSFIFFIALLSYVISSSSFYDEVDALIKFKLSLQDPTNALKSWEATNTNPCVWFHIACNTETRVTRIDIASANLTGSLAPSLGSLLYLERLELYSNNFFGKIPAEFGNLENLISLDLYLNNLEGSIPDTLGNLKKLEQLLLNNNSLSGTIPVELTTIETLKIVDLSHNQLTGDVPTNGSFGLLSPVSFLNNKNLVLPPATSRSNFSTVSPPSQLNVKAIIGGAVVGAALLFAIPLLCLRFLKNAVNENFVDLPDEREAMIQLGQLKRFSLRELQVATDYFHRRNIVGTGGFAKVYKGRLADGSPVAVKRLKEERISAGEDQFRAQIELISMAVHENLIRLCGYCMTTTERLLVYPFMAHGSVAANLKGRKADKPPLSWETRCRIALGTAKALAYLHEHCRPRIIHRDVKADNILLNDAMEAVVADFGLARLMDSNMTHVVTRACGTRGHIAPEYMASGMVSEKTDVYGYGMTLLQLLTGHPTKEIVQMAHMEELELLDWVKSKAAERRLDELVDGDMEGLFNEEEVEQMVKMAIICMSSLPKDRLTMAEVVTIFEGHALPERLEGWRMVRTVNTNLRTITSSSAHGSLANWSSMELSGPR